MVSIGDWLSQGWGLVKPHLGTYIGVALVTAILSTVTLGILIGPLACGWYLMLLRQLREESYVPQFGDLWKGFEVFGQSLLAYILIVVAAAVVGSLIGVMGAAVAAVPLVGQALAPLVGTAVAVCLMVVFLYVFPLIVDRRMDFWKAIQTSAETTAPHFGQLIGFGLVLYLLNGLGALLCGLGALVTTPVVMASIAVSYLDMLRDPTSQSAATEQAQGPGANVLEQSSEAQQQSNSAEKDSPSAHDHRRSE